MLTLLQFDFPHPGPWGEAMTSSLSELAQDIAAEPGLRWKIWNENSEEGTAGGIYLFEEEDKAMAFLEKHRARLEKFGYTNVRVRVFNVNQALSKLTGAPV